MNLQKLFEIQEGLDNLITKEHPVKEGEDRLAKKILALQVELGELANEWKMFKYWKVNPKSNVSKFTTCSNEEAEHYFCVTCHHNYSVEKAVDMDFVCPTDDNDLMPMKQVNPMLEEYVDCLHFILSIGLELEITDVEIDSDYTHEDPSATFVELFGDAWELFNFREIHDELRFIQIGIYERMFNRFIGIGEEHLGFTWEQVEQAYMEKNRINERQLNIKE